MGHGHEGLIEAESKGGDAESHLAGHQQKGTEKERPLAPTPATRHQGKQHERDHQTGHWRRRSAMQKQPAASLTLSQAALGSP